MGAWLGVSVTEMGTPGCHRHPRGVGWAAAAVAVSWEGAVAGGGSGALPPVGTPLWLHGGVSGVPPVTGKSSRFG